MRIVLVTQDLAQVASWVRLLVEQTYRMTKLTAIGSRKKFRVDVFQGAATGQTPPRSRLIRQLYGQYKPSVYRYYSSATQSATGQVGDESTADKRANIWRSPFMIFAMVAPLVGVPLFLWWVVSIFASGFGMLPEDELPPEPVVLVNPPPPLPAPSVPDVPAVEVVQAPPLPSGPAPSTVWRVAGYMLRAEQAADGQPRDIVLLSSALYGLRRVPVDQCERLPDGINWQCVVDGQHVTPWTGRGDATQFAGSSGAMIGRTVRVASGATNADSDALTNPDPPPATL